MDTKATDNDSNGTNSKKNSWITAKSKSYPDKTYFYNIVTGEAVWNMRETTEKKCATQTSKNIVPLKEPKGPPPITIINPMAYCNNLQPDTVGAIPNDQLVQQLLTSQLINQHNMTSAQVIKPYAYQNSLVPQVPYRNFERQFLPHAQNNQNVNKVWDVQPSHPSFLNPQIPITELTLPMQPRIVVPEIPTHFETSDNMRIHHVRATAIPLTSRFKIINEISKDGQDNTANQIFERRPVHEQRTNLQRKSVLKRKFNNSGITDLRQILIAKNKLKDESSSPTCVEEKIEDHFKSLDLNKRQIQAQIHVKVDDSEPKLIDNKLEMDEQSPENEDEIWLENGPSKFNITKLYLQKFKLSYNIGDGNWYIVADTNVLLSNLFFMKALLTSDEKCRLLLVETVLRELLTAARDNTRLENPAVVALQSLEQMLEIGQVVREQDLYTEENVRCPMEDDQIINSCLRIFNNDIFFMILSNDKMLQRKAQMSQVPAFSVEELKQLMKSFETKVLDLYRADSTVESSIKINKQNKPKYLLINDFATASIKSAQSVGYNVSKTISRNPELNSRPMTVNSQHIMTVNCNTMAGNSKSVTINRKPVTVNSKPVTVNSKTVTVNSELVTVRSKPVTVSSKLVTENSEPVTVNSKPVTNKKPVTVSSKPVKVNSKPVTNKKPVTVLHRKQEDKTFSEPEPNVLATLNKVADKLTKIETSVSKTSAVPRNKPQIERTISMKNTHQGPEKTSTPCVVGIRTRKINLKRNQTHTVTPANFPNAEKSKSRWWRRKKLVDSPNTNQTILNSSNNTNESHCDQPSQSVVINELNTIPKPCSDNKVSPRNTEDSEPTSPNIRFGLPPQTDHYQSKIIEESSVSESDIISNTNSSVYSHGLNISLQKSLQISKTAKLEQKFGNHNSEVMFQVDTPTMEENLVSRLEEWIVRFIQILDDVLRQVMQQYQSTSKKPPLHNIVEAIDSVKKRFWDNFEVQKTGRNLTTVLREASDEKGNVSDNIAPDKFMELFSRAMFFVDALKIVLPKCIALQVAMESLIALLTDIKFCDTMDSFGDCDLLSSSKGCDDSETSDNNVKTLEEVRTMPNISSTKKDEFMDPTKVGISQTVTFVRNITCPPDYWSKNGLLSKTPCESESDTQDSNIDNKLNAATVDSPEEVTAHFNNDKECTGPRVIFNFQKCSEFEERLFKKKSLDMDLLDYSESEDADEEIITENYSDIGCKEKSTASTDKSESDSSESGENNIMNFIANFLAEIKRIFLEVYEFCEQTHKLISNVTIKMCAAKKIELIDQSSSFYHLITNMLRTLESITERESNEPANNIQALLRKSGLDESFVLSDSQRSTYKEVIAKCAAQAGILLEALESVKSAIDMINDSSSKVPSPL